MWAMRLKRYCERWFWILCSIYGTRIISISNDSSKSHGYHIQIARVRRTSSWCSICFIPRSKWKMLQNYSKFQNRNVQVFGFVYHDTSGQDHGHTLMIQSFFLSEICTVILWQDYYGKGNSRKFYWNNVGTSSKLGMFTRQPRERTILVCVCGRYKMGRNKTLTQCGKYLWKTLIWENRHRSVTTFIWVALKENAKRAKILWKITETCLNLGSPQEQKKSYFVQEDLTQISPHGPMIWKVMQRNFWKDFANWRTKQLNNDTKSQVLAWMIINSSRKNSTLWENYQKLLTRCLEMLVFGTCWTTRHLVVSKQDCKISHKTDSGMWQKISKADCPYIHHTMGYRMDGLLAPDL